MAGSGLSWKLFFCNAFIVSMLLSLTSAQTPNCGCGNTGDGPFQYDDPHKYYVCSGSSSYTFTCPLGTLFENNANVQGCIGCQYFQWPNETPTVPPSAGPPDCSQYAVVTGIPYCDPSYYWQCNGKSLTKNATLLQCPPGQGFASGPYNYGCVAWSLWRNPPQ